MIPIFGAIGLTFFIWKAYQGIREEFTYAEVRQWIRHKLGWNRGHVMSWTTPEGRVQIGFMCEDCLSVHGVSDITDMVKHL
jgi:hypothetical protein